MRRRIAILGSTGSIGVNTLKVIANLKDRFEVSALAADSNIKLLAKQSRIFRPKTVSVGDSSLADAIKRLIPSGTRLVCGQDGLNEIVSTPGVELAVFAISGSPCLIPLVTAIEHKKEIALANKEALVSAGSLLMRLAKAKGVKLIPVDSEHSAIFQCLEGKRNFLSRIYLTGSGGPLLNVPKARFDKMPKRSILAHPKWKMGRKISVDSATMMNKGLEIIEARWLFDIEQKFIDVLIHPEAIIHSMVEFVDGTILAQLGVPDMRGPIQYALTYPGRFKSMVRKIDFSKIRRLSFSQPDLGKFPCLKLAREALVREGTHPAVLNAADEEVVKNYLSGAGRFSDIPKVIEKILERHRDVKEKEPSIGDILNAMEWAREEARSLCYH